MSRGDPKETAPGVIVKRRRHRLLRLSALAGSAAPIALLVPMMWAVGVTPGFDPVHDVVSALAAAGATTAEVMTAGLILFEALLLAFVPAVRAALPRAGRGVSLAVALHGLTVLVVAAVPCGPSCFDRGLSVVETVHGGAVGVGAVGFLAAPLLSAAVAEPHGWRYYRPSCAAAAAVTAAATLVMGVRAFAPGPYAGAAELATILAAAGWYGVTGALVLRRVPATAAAGVPVSRTGRRAS